MVVEVLEIIIIYQQLDHGAQITTILVKK